MTTYEGAEPVVIKIHGECGETSRVDVGGVSVEFECRPSSEGADVEDEQPPASGGELDDFLGTDLRPPKSGHSAKIEIPVHGWDMLQEMTGEEINLAAEPMVVQILPGAEDLTTLGDALARARSEHRRLILDVNLRHGQGRRGQ